ncbi:DUF4395 domain-containing protein [Bacteroidales bacterium]|nr:DUF4395 domain-containing protein [Bacteroidales bacterium]
MTHVCPIDTVRVNERVSRLNALITLVFATIYILTPFKEIVFLMIADFATRLIASGKYSPVSNANKILLAYANIKPQMINAGPKKFAAKIGLLMSAIIAVLYIAQLSITSLSLISMLGFFAFLEMSIGFCVACKVYPFIYSE